VHSAVHPLRERRPSTLMGEGQVAMIGQALKETEAGSSIVDARDQSPSSSATLSARGTRRCSIARA
jgi:50S ribosomal subunit-associated GTPase HflX